MPGLFSQRSLTVRAVVKNTELAALAAGDACRGVTAFAAIGVIGRHRRVTEHALTDPQPGFTAFADICSGLQIAVTVGTGTGGQQVAPTL